MRLMLYVLFLLLALSGASMAQDKAAEEAAVRVGAGTIRACVAAVNELSAARNLIATQEKEISALNVRLDVEKERAALANERVSIRDEQIKALNDALVARQAAEAALKQTVELQTGRIVSLEKKLSRSRKLGVIAAVATLVLGVLAGGVVR